MSSLCRIALALVTALCLTSCGGGGGGGSSSKATTPTPTATTTTPTAVASSPVVTSPADTAVNAIPVTVANALGGSYPNILYATVTICAPNTTNCVAIPNIQVDTGSTGLRLVASAIGTTVRAGLGVQYTPSGTPAAECGQFADGITWGSVRTATVTLGTLSTTAAVPIQLILDQPYEDANVSSTPPPSCTASGPAEQTSSVLGANGIIGIGYFLQDCGSGCDTPSGGGGFYYDCPTSTGCVADANSGMPLASQISNPVASLATGYNNGDIIQLPALSASGAASASGYLILGLGTTTNNQLQSTPIGLDPNYGFFSVSYNGQPYTSSFMDSGSSVYFFANSALPSCATSSVANGFFCPSSTYSGTGVITSEGSQATTTYAFNFSVANALTLFDTYPNAYAFNNLGAPVGTESFGTGGGSFDMGLPFFFGNDIYTAFEPAIPNTPTAGYVGPYTAVSPAPTS